MRNIVLIGMPGSGKTTIGATLAQNLGYRLIDTDWLVMDTYGKSLQAVIAEAGVDGFLRYEGLVGEGIACEHCVIATGGSMVFSNGAMQNLRRLGTVVWLDAPLDVLKRRITAGSDRGIAAEAGVTVEQLDDVRRPLYERYADICVQSVGTKRDIAAQVERLVRAQGATARDERADQSE